MNTQFLFAQMPSPPTTAGDFFTSGLGLIAVILVLILAALWIIFPFMVYSKFNELIRATKRTADLLEEIERNSRKPEDAKEFSAARYGLEEASSSNSMAVVVIAAVVILAVVILVAARH